MKTMKRMAGVLLALVMALALTVPAFAAGETYTITAPENEHTYEIYQIFTGDLSQKVLSNVKWGKNGTGTEGTAVSDTILEEIAGASGSDTQQLAVITKYVNLKSTPLNTVGGKTDAEKGTTRVESVDVAPGYYLIKDVDGSLAGMEDSYTLYLVKVVNDVNITPKADVPEVTKKVQDKNDSTGISSTWQDSADYDIGDSVPFQLKATLATNVSAYTTYKVVFHDTLSAGLTYNNDAVVKVNGVDKAESFSITESNGILTISCNDVKALGATDSSVITVDYTATLNEGAVVGGSGNTNKVYLQFSNDPNHSGTGDSYTGNTPEDTVVVFTYKTIINKVDGENAALTGAAFKLEKLIKGETSAEDTWTTVKEFTVDAQNPASSFEFSGLDDGTYKLTETVTPAGYNTIAPITFRITATHSEGDTPVLTDLEGNPIEGTITFSKDLSKGSLSAAVVNKAGALLPETGGIGTTIFYVLGGALMLGAVVLLVTKKRMNAE